MEILFIASEVAPFAGTGGLSSMVGMLTRALAVEGISSNVILPLYSAIDRKKHGITYTGRTVKIDMAGRIVEGRIWSCDLPGKGVCPGTAYFIEMAEYYDRDALYGNDEGDYPDNCERFIFFCRAAIEAAEELELTPDVIHCHDWQAALVPVYLKTLYNDTALNVKASSLLTIHNLAYQGLFWHWDWPLTGLDWSLFSWRALEFYGKINLLKGGIVFADAISTVSKTYSREIQLPEYGCGMEGVLTSRQDVLYGVVHGLDYEVWDPASDLRLVENFSPDDLSGKALCKQAAQRECGLQEDEEIPLLLLAGELTEQCGLELVEECFDALMGMSVQMVVHGRGLRHHEEELADLSRNHRAQSCVTLSNDSDQIHRLMAGADIFIRPSRFEPCGGMQLAALRYGTVSVVRSTGALADTIEDYSPEGLESGRANGFVFLEYNSASLLDEISRALGYFQEDSLWRELMFNGMGQDWSFRSAARRYRDIYQRLGDEK